MASIIKDTNLFCTCCKEEHKLTLPIDQDLFHKKSEHFTRLHEDCVEPFKYGLTVDELTESIMKGLKPMEDGVTMLSKTCDTCEYEETIFGYTLTLKCHHCKNIN